MLHASSSLKLLCSIKMMSTHRNECQKARLSTSRTQQRDSISWSAALQKHARTEMQGPSKEDLQYLKNARTKMPGPTTKLKNFVGSSLKTRVHQNANSSNILEQLRQQPSKNTRAPECQVEHTRLKPTLSKNTRALACQVEHIRLRSALSKNTRAPECQVEHTRLRSTLSKHTRAPECQVQHTRLRVRIDTADSATSAYANENKYVLLI